MTEPTIKTTDELKAVLDKIAFLNTALDFKWQFHHDSIMIPVGLVLKYEWCHGWLLWCSFERPDTNTGKIGRGRGRDEIVWEGATVSAVVKTCWVLVELLVRHELMEGFRWDGARIFNPHNTVEELAALQRKDMDTIWGKVE